MTLLKQLAFLMFVIVNVGCFGPETGSVTGRVLVDGVPQAGFNVCYHSVADGSTALGATGTDGQYHLVQARTKLFSTGDYKVTFEPASVSEGSTIVPKVKIPKEFANVSTTTLVKTVGARANVIDLEITAQK